jgi:hypothetical protein
VDESLRQDSNVLKYDYLSGLTCTLRCWSSWECQGFAWSSLETRSCELFMDSLHCSIWYWEGFMIAIACKHGELCVMQIFGILYLNRHLYLLGLWFCPHLLFESWGNVMVWSYCLVGFSFGCLLCSFSIITLVSITKYLLHIMFFFPCMSLKKIYNRRHYKFCKVETETKVDFILMHSNWEKGKTVRIKLFKGVTKWQKRLSYPVSPRGFLTLNASDPPKTYIQVLWSKTYDPPIH